MGLVYLANPSLYKQYSIGNLVDLTWPLILNFVRHITHFSSSSTSGKRTTHWIVAGFNYLVGHEFTVGLLTHSNLFPTQRSSCAYHGIQYQFKAIEPVINFRSFDCPSPLHIAIKYTHTLI